MKQAVRWVFVMALLVHGVYLVSLYAGFLNPLFINASRFKRKGQGQAADFFVFYSSACRLARGESIYRAQSAETPYMYGRYKYLPFFVFTIIWLALLPPWTAYVAWLLLIEGALAFAILLALRWNKRQGRPFSPWLAAALFIVPTPLYLEMYMGQNTFLFAVLVMVFLYCVARGGRRIAAFVSYVLSAVLKMGSLLYIPVLLRRKAFAFVALGLVVLLVPNLVYFVLIDRSSVRVRFAPKNKVEQATTQAKPGKKLKMPMVKFDRRPGEMKELAAPFTAEVKMPTGVYYFLQHVLRTPGSLYYPSVCGFSSLFYCLTKSIPAFKLWAVALWLVVFAVLIWRPGAPLLDFSLIIAAFFLSHTFAWEHHYTLIYPLIILCIMRFPRQGWFFWPAFVLVALPTPFIFFNQLLISNPLYYLPKSLGVVLFFAGLVVVKIRCWRDGTPGKG